MAEHSIEDQIDAWFELATKINQMFLGLGRPWPEGREYVHLPYKIDPWLEELRKQAGGSFYVEGGKLRFIRLDEMDADASRTYKESLLNLLKSGEEAGYPRTRIELLLEKLP